MTPLEISLATERLSPPYSESPQVTIEPSSFKARNARSVEKILETPLDSSSATEILPTLRPLLSPP